MLINALRPEELRVAVVTGSTLDNYQVEAEDRNLTRGNIYRGVVTNIQPSLNAAFIDYGAERNGFLAIQDVVPEAHHRNPKTKGRPKIEEVLEKGKPILVQVTREAEGQKGAVVTTSLSLAGRYLVLTPFDDTVGVSRKVEDDETRKLLRTQVSKLDVPEGCGAIVRTNALDQSKVALNRDFAALMRLWKQVQAATKKGKGVRLLYNDQDLILRALRDYLDSSIEEILIDDEATFNKAETYLKAFMPRGKVSLKRYSDRVPLFARYDLERQIDNIYERRVELPSGGSIVIDRTEALTAIDVNSGKSTGASSQEETALATNLEAAREVARQLRLRDIGGLMVVDFIDMRAHKSQRKVEKTLRDEMKADKARFSTGRISPNGLLEINRQRIQQALSLRTHRSCPTCDGTGRIASPEMVGLSLLRRIEGRAASGALKRARIALHPELADAFQNGRRREIAELEAEFDIRVEVIAASHLHRPEQEIDWIEREPGDLPVRRRPLPKASVDVTQMVIVSGDEDDEDDDGDDGGESGGGEGEGKNGKRPRKRRRRKRGSDQEDAADKRSGKRPEKKSKGPEKEPRGPEREPERPETGPEKAAGTGGGEEGKEHDEAAAGGKTPSGSRRRRRTKSSGGGRQSSRGRGEGAAGSRAEAGDARPAPEPSGTEGSGGEGKGEAGGEGNGKPRRRRRRRTRRGKGEGGGSGGED